MPTLSFLPRFVHLRPRRGQALVETAIMIPVILILLLGAIDFGRAFFSWVTLNQAARIGANFASIDPTTTSADIPTLIESETDGIPGCAQDTPVLSYTAVDGTPVTNPQLGDYANLQLGCDFELITPLAGILFGNPVPMGAVSSFPIRTGCINCPAGPPGPPPPPPPEQCRTVPAMTGMSVQGARLAWQSAGFLAANFTPVAGQDTQTVGSFSITTSDVSCTSPFVIFNASVTVVVVPPDAVTAGCATVPNLIGLTVAQARSTWAASPFTGGFLPTDQDALVVTDQTTTPPSAQPGVTCLDTSASIEVDTGPAWPAPPPTPCQVPHMIDKTRPVAKSEWIAKGFADAAFSPSNGNFTVKSQSLVGFSWVDCDSSVTVSASP